MKYKRYTIYFFLFLSAILLLSMILIDLSFELFYKKSSIIHNYRNSPNATVAIVPGASVIKNRPSIVLKDRLECAYLLYKNRKVKKILLSGDNGTVSYNEVKPMLIFMLQRNVKKEDIFVDHAGFRTLDTILRARDVFKVRDAIIVTQKFHQPRAIYLASKAGLKVFSFEADQRIYQNRRFNRVREFFARTLAWMDINLFHTDPKYLGKEYFIEGSGIPTWKGSIY